MDRLNYNLEFLEGIAEVGFIPESCVLKLKVARKELDRLNSDGNYREEHINQYLVIRECEPEWFSDYNEAESSAQKVRGSFLFEFRKNHFTKKLDLHSLKDDPYVLSRENISKFLEDYNFPS